MPFSYKYTSNVQCSLLVELCVCVSVFICVIQIHADVKNWVSVQNLMQKILLPKFIYFLLVGDYGRAENLW